MAAEEARRMALAGRFRRMFSMHRSLLAWALVARKEREQKLHNEAAEERHLEAIIRVSGGDADG